MRFVLTIFVLAPFLGFTQFNGPESVEYDPNGGRYFISNSSSGEIMEQVPGQTATVFVSGVGSGPHGLELMGDTLYACSGGRVKGYDRTTGAEVINMNLNGSFLNGITTDGQFLYVTDFSASKIYRVDPVNGVFNEYVSNTGGTPNGILYDGATENRLIVVFWGFNAPIKAVDMSDSTISTIATTSLGNCDGIAKSCVGKYYVSSWSPQRITEFDATFSSSSDYGVTVSSPADLDFSEDRAEIGIPNSGNNTVDYVVIPECALSITENKIELNIYPNPATSEINFPPCDLIELVSLDGKKVISQSGNSGQIVLNEIPTGMYIIQMHHNGDIAYSKLTIE